MHDEPERAPLIKAVVSFLRPHFTAAGSALGISELCPGVPVSAPSQAVGHILRIVLADLLCQAPAANSYALAAVRNSGSLLLTVSARPLQVDDARRGCLDSGSPGLRLAADIARDQALRWDLMPDAGCRHFGAAGAGRLPGRRRVTLTAKSIMLVGSKMVD